MKKFILLVPLLVLAACSSAPPQYEKMRTADDALNKYDQNQIKDGMAITKKGAVVDIKTEEVQAEKNRLELENQDKQKQIELLETKAHDLEHQIMELRLALGLPAERPKSQGKCCTADGKMIPGTVKDAPSLQDELAAIKNRKGASEASSDESSQEN